VGLWWVSMDEARGDPAVSPPGIDTSVPNMARVYDALLGGKDNFTADRIQAARLIEFDPSLPLLVRQNREFVSRVVTWAARRGIGQFLDLGAGLPTHPAVHEAARQVIPSARVVYVDSDPVAVVHARALLAEPDGVTAVGADLTEPERVMSRQTLGDLLDPAEPVCVLIAAVLHFMSAEAARDLVSRYARLLPPGSALAVSVFGSDDPGVAEQARQAYTATRTYTHSREDVASFLAGAGLELVEPGVALAHAWRGDMPGPGLTVTGPFRVLAAVGILGPGSAAGATAAPGGPGTRL
jgi:O-methyltransferase involved in polyketide biosynthesis